MTESLHLDRLHKRFGLTPSEGQLAVHLATGDTLRAASSTLGDRAHTAQKRVRKDRNAQTDRTGRVAGTQNTRAWKPTGRRSGESRHLPLYYNGQLLPSDCKGTCLGCAFGNCKPNRPIAEQSRTQMSLRGVAKALSARGIKTARGGEWSALQVRDILQQCGTED